MLRILFSEVIVCNFYKINYTKIFLVLRFFCHNFGRDGKATCAMYVRVEECSWESKMTLKFALGGAPLIRSPLTTQRERERERKTHTHTDTLTWNCYEIIYLWKSIIVILDELGSR